MKRIFFNKGIAHERRGLEKINVESIDVQSCSECGFDFCDCAIIMKDLAVPDDKYIIAVVNGELVIATYANFLLYKESGDTADLSATVVGTQS